MTKEDQQQAESERRISLRVPSALFEQLDEKRHRMKTHFQPVGLALFSAWLHETGYGGFGQQEEQRVFIDSSAALAWLKAAQDEVKNRFGIEASSSKLLDTFIELNGPQAFEVLVDKFNPAHINQGGRSQRLNSSVGVPGGSPGKASEPEHELVTKLKEVLASGDTTAMEIAVLAVKASHAHLHHRGPSDKQIDQVRRARAKSRELAGGGAGVAGKDRQPAKTGDAGKTAAPHKTRTGTND